MVATVISEIQQAQKSDFHFSKDIPLLNFITYGLHLLDEDRKWELSFKCEASSTGADSHAKILANENQGSVRNILKRFTVQPEKEAEEILVTVNPLFGKPKLKSRKQVI